ncbi:GNAT family N-acetyltransferase [Luteimicrobium subarcticum]|uniref:Ribosomal protein S18 acetylase RimI-like enzyme n=1 Tax=Luteimicrobium subarcticum TaxID=620910 RepID=A0A2M8W1B5_9MICO|nr:N-acetyltransferase [Luteimicrobium subarcticum]PJI84706.1 ribosomal protein S18 acetylase RimI-like enzyme [Luteimicrobium subarcticum]
MTAPDPQPVVRPATTDDLEALADVAAATFPLACPPGTTPEDVDAFVAAHLSRERFTAYLGDERRDVLVAVEGGGDGGEPGTVIGYAMTVAGEPADADVGRAVRARPTLELSKLYVLPGHHGAGVSAELVASVLECAQVRGVASVWLGVNQLNVRAQRFYTKSGFARVGTKTFQVGDQLHDDYVMERVVR